jgi:hypothetical protein
MKRFALAVSLLALTGQAFAAGEEKTASGGDPMEGWAPPKVKNEKTDRQEILALFKAMETAEKKGDLNAAASLVDFPVLMVTDDAKGQAASGTWDREKWTKVMEPFYKHPMPGVKVTHKASIFMISDSLASVDDQATITHGNKTIRARNSTLVVRKDGRWFVKAMVEGGWGDVMKKEQPASATEETTPQSGTGSSGGGSTGTGSGTTSGTGAAPTTPPQVHPQPQGSSSDATK